MTFQQYWLILTKQWKLVVICFLLVGLGAFTGSKLIKPLYQSSVLVQVVIRSSNNNQADYSNLQASTLLVQTESTLAVSNSVLNTVASHYPGLTTSQLAGEVSSSPKVNTQLFEIDVTDPSPLQAATLANDIATTLIKQQSQATQQGNSQAQQQIQQNIDLTSQQIEDTTTKISALQTPGQPAGANQGQLAHLQSQLSGLQQRYNQWQTDLAQLGLTQAQSGNPLQVTQPAQPSGSPVSPNTLLNTGTGLLIGLALGMVLALLYELIDKRVRTPEELAQLLKWPILTTTWRVDSVNPADVVNSVGGNINVEPYRILRTNIGFSSLDKPLHSLLVTSGLPHEGKSVTAANLAIFMAKAGKSTLLIDADLRNPTQHTYFNLPAQKAGLSNAVLAFSTPEVPKTPSYHQFNQSAWTKTSQVEPLTTGLSLEPFIHSVGLSNLWVMPSGPLPPNPSEFLESKAMRRFLTVIANCGIEVVIFDSPPLLGLSDASILASRVDAALVVVDITRATKEKIKQIKGVLSQTGVHVLGCVANKLQRKRNDNTYYFYTDDPNGEEKPARDGYFPSIPVTPVLNEPHFEQKVRSN